MTAATLAWSAWLAASAMARSQTPAMQDTTPLAFLGFRPGTPLLELSAELQRRRGRLHCRRSRSDPRVRECRGTLPDRVAGDIAVWVSAIDSTAGVITLSAPVSPTALGVWRDELARRYGRVQPVAQGSQRMMQWVRRGRMLRLTWRAEGAGTTASVSLVDGRVLDRWGRERNPGTEPGR